MLPLTLLLPSLFITTTTAADPPPVKPFDCGTDTAHAPDSFLEAIQALHNGSPSGGSPASRARSLNLLPRAPTTGPITVDTVFHIVATDDTKDDISNDMPSLQLDVLNEAYSPHDIHFNLLNITWTTNSLWATGAGGDADRAMKRALRQCSYSTLNIYFQTSLAGGVLGRCTLPSSLGASPGSVPRDTYFSDGCNVNANTMPGGLLAGYNKGKTVVHETGHWLGLLHTFEGFDCEGPGGYIEDTPPEKESTEGCPRGKKTCPGVLDGEGKEVEDPIWNFMDHSWDECYEGFSEGQVRKVRELWGLRGGG
ncbi:zincin [Sporormia fimetaria CBS 119925]|uniref:Zincin n=1 Tax=Sporormia fimetaria CBS 119925 TaxID=1340428 RepID=A0A6A6VAL5_9PLEO|nr:zincin [Sporormia fimetaria CBS 119925]